MPICFLGDVFASAWDSRGTLSNTRPSASASTAGVPASTNRSRCCALWAGKLLDFKGVYHRIDRAALNPCPRRSIPIWCGGGSEGTYRRAASLAVDLVLSGSFEECVLPGWERLRVLLVEEGRDPAGFGAEYLISERLDAAATL